MKGKLPIWLLLIPLFGCDNPFTIDYTLIYTNDEPNEEFAMKLEEVLEDEWNVDIQLNKAQNVQSVISALESEEIDMGLVENLVNVGDGIHTVVPVYQKVLHLFYKANLSEVNSIESLFYGHTVYCGVRGSAAHEFMGNLFDYYQLDRSRIKETENRFDAEVVAIFSVLMSSEELANYQDFKLFSIDKNRTGEGSQTHGIALRFPRVRPFVIPESTYGELSPEPIHTIATDMVYVVREHLGKIAVNDLINTLFLHREQFVHVHPAFYYGIVEDFDRSKLSYSLHEGAQAYFDRDEPGFFERYAELAGVIFTVVLAVGSGVLSMGKRRRQRKKDKVDVFYEHLMKIKNELPLIKSMEVARSKIQEVKDEQDRAFKMLINEELEANDSFRIYMQLSKETIDDIRIRLRILKDKAQRG